MQAMPPRLEDRQERPYVAIAATLSVQEEPRVVPGLVSKLEAWVAEKNIEKTGPPFVRYKVIDMPADLKIEVGIPVPVGAPVVEEGRVQRGAPFEQCECLQKRASASVQACVPSVRSAPSPAVFSSCASSSNSEYDLILMDCHMPELDGWEASRRIRAAGNGRQVPIIGCTASSTEKEMEQCFEAGMNELLVKPVQLPDLARMLSKWVPESVRFKHHAHDGRA